MYVCVYTNIDTVNPRLSLSPTVTFQKEPPKGFIFYNYYAILYIYIYVCIHFFSFFQLVKV